MDPAIIQDLEQKRTQLSARRTRLQVLLEQDEAERIRVEEQMKQWGSTPATIDADIEEEERKLAEAVEKDKEALRQVEEQIIKAEQHLEQ